MSAEPLLTPRLKKAWAIANGYISARKCNVLGTPELLVGIVRSEGPALGILAKASGCTEAEITRRIIAEVDNLHPPVPSGEKKEGVA